MYLLAKISCVSRRNSLYMQKPEDTTKEVSLKEDFHQLLDKTNFCDSDVLMRGSCLLLMFGKISPSRQGIGN